MSIAASRVGPARIAVSAAQHISAAIAIATFVQQLGRKAPATSANTATAGAEPKRYGLDRLERLNRPARRRCSGHALRAILEGFCAAEICCSDERRMQQTAPTSGPRQHGS